MAHSFYFSPHILDNLHAPQTGFDVVKDTEEPRLCMYITSRGAKSFFVRKRIGGRDIRIIIGNYPEVDIDVARTAVDKVLANASKKTPVRRRPIVFRIIFNNYIENKVKRADESRIKLVRTARRHLGPIMDKIISEISTADINDTINKIRGVTIRNRMRDLVVGIFNFAMQGGFTKSNPAAEIPKMAENRRIRTINDESVRRLHSAITNMEDLNLRAAFLMLVYSFTNKTRVFSMRWDDLDFNNYTWCGLPLSDNAVTLLNNLPQDGDWVFPGARRGGHLTDPRTAWRKLTALARTPGLQMDDLHKFIMRKLTWSPDREALRDNMNTILWEIFQNTFFNSTDL